MILLGIYMLLAGGRFPSLGFVIYTTIVFGITLTFWIFNYALPAYFPTWTVFGVLYICCGLGCGLGFGCAKWPRMGVTFLSFTLGVFFAFSLEQILFKHIFPEGSVGPLIMKLIIIAATITFFHVFFSYTVVIASTLIGSYMLIRVSTPPTNPYRQSRCSSVATPQKWCSP